MDFDLKPWLWSWANGKPPEHETKAQLQSANRCGKLSVLLAVRPSLRNGLFQRVAPRRDLLGHSRLIYEKRIGISKRFCCYYWEGSLTSNKDRRTRACRNAHSFFHANLSMAFSVCSGTVAFKVAFLLVCPVRFLA